MLRVSRGRAGRTANSARTVNKCESGVANAGQKLLRRGNSGVRRVRHGRHRRLEGAGLRHGIVAGRHVRWRAGIGYWLFLMAWGQMMGSSLFGQFSVLAADASANDSSGLAL